MATLVLGTAGQYYFGPIGGLVGALIGSYIDNILFGSGGGGTKLSDIQTQGTTPGKTILLTFGNIRVSGEVIWAGPLRTEEDSGGKGGIFGGGSGGGEIKAKIDIAIAVCLGPIFKIGRVWGDTKLIYRDGQEFRKASDQRIYLGDEAQMPDPTIEGHEGEGSVSGYRGICYVVYNNLKLNGFGNRVPNLTFEVITKDGSTGLRDVVEGLILRGGFVASDYDLGRLPLTCVEGAAFGSNEALATSIEDLQTAYRFYVYESDFKLKFSETNKHLEGIICLADMAAHEPTPGQGDLPPTKPTTRQQELELPREVNIKFFDKDRDYERNDARSTRQVTGSNKVTVIDIPIVMEPEKAKVAATNFLIDAWAGRLVSDIKLPPKYIFLDPGDIITIPDLGQSFPRFRIQNMAIGASGLIEMQIAEDVFRWGEITGQATLGTFTGGDLITTTNIEGFLLDLPLLRFTDVDDAGFYFAGGPAVDTLNEPSYTLFQSFDDVTYTEIGGDTDEIFYGNVVGASLLDGPADYKDRFNTITVAMNVGELSSISDDSLYRVGNLALIGDEIVQFQNATLISPETYTLDTFLRGRYGTDPFISTHVADERFILLDTSNFSAINQYVHIPSLLNTALDYKFLNSEQEIDDVTKQAFTNTGISKKPWTVVQMGGTRNGSNDLAIVWRRRDRIAPTGIWEDGHDVPMSETTESYEIDIMDGASVKNTYFSTIQSFTYTAAQQVADWGSTQNPITVRIFQMSDIVGRGYQREMSL